MSLDVNSMDSNLICCPLLSLMPPNGLDGISGVYAENYQEENVIALFSLSER